MAQKDPRILILRHERGDDLRQWRTLFARLGVTPRFADFSVRPGLRPSLRGADGLVLLGGSIDVHEAASRPHLSREMELVRDAAASGMPVLGICLGAQLVTQALGGRVRKSRRPEIGWTALRPTGHRVFQWHAFECVPPKGTRPLSSTAACRFQAFRLRENVLAAQYHFEIDERTIRDWLGESRLSQSRRRRILADTRKYLDGSQALGGRIWTDFVSAVRRFSHRAQPGSASGGMRLRSSP